MKWSLNLAPNNLNWISGSIKKEHKHTKEKKHTDNHHYLLQSKNIKEKNIIPIPHQCSLWGGDGKKRGRRNKEGKGRRGREMTTQDIRVGGIL